MTGRLARALAWVCTIAGLGFGFIGVATAAPSGSSSPRIAVSVNGGGFGVRPSGALVMDAAAPGSETRTLLGVRSGVDDVTQVALRLNDADARQAVALSRSVRFTIRESDERGAVGKLLWTGTAQQLMITRSSGILVAPGSSGWLQLTASVPASAGNEISSQTLEFDLDVTLVSGGVGVAGVTVGRGAEHRTRGSQRDPRGPDAITDLGDTGLTPRLLISAAVLLGGGLLLLLAPRLGRRRPAGPSRVRPR